MGSAFLVRLVVYLDLRKGVRSFVLGFRMVQVDLHIELPSLDMVASLLVRDHHNEFGDLPTNHPFVELGHDLLNISFDLVIGCN